MELIRSAAGKGLIFDALHRAFAKNCFINIELADHANDNLDDVCKLLGSEPALRMYPLINVVIRKIFKNVAHIKKRRMEEEEHRKKKAKREQPSGPSAASAKAAPESPRAVIRRRAACTLGRVNRSHSKANVLYAHLRAIVENEATPLILEHDGEIKVQCFGCPNTIVASNWSNYERHLRMKHKENGVPLLLEKQRKTGSPVAEESSSAQSMTLNGEIEEADPLRKELDAYLNAAANIEGSELSNSSVERSSQSPDVSPQETPLRPN